MSLWKDDAEEGAIAQQVEMLLAMWTHCIRVLVQGPAAALDSC